MGWKVGGVAFGGEALGMPVVGGRVVVQAAITAIMQEAAAKRVSCFIIMIHLSLFVIARQYSLVHLSGNYRSYWLPSM